MKRLIRLLPALLLTLTAVLSSASAQTVPSDVTYEGRLLDASRNPVTTQVTLRFSLWKSSDWTSADVSGSSVNTAAAQYGGWFEAQTVTPSAGGIVSVRLGSQTTFPTVDFALHKYLQVEVKAAGQPDSAYQMLDPTGDSGADTDDRKYIGSVPYAKNAETLQNRSIGTGSGSLPLLGSGGLLPQSTVPGGTYRDLFSLDSDDSATDSVTLQFGQTLAKTLSYNVVGSRFEFSDSLYIDGDLTVTGLINGIDLSTLGPGGTGAQIVLREFHAEYPHAAYKGDGSDNVGQLIVTNDGSSLRNYYQWTSTRSTLQDYDIFVRATLPQTFLRWKDNPLSLTYRSSTGAVAAAQADVAVFDTAGTLVTLSGSILGLNAASWVTTEAEFTGSPVWTAGQEVVIRIRLSAKDLQSMQVADLKLQYYTQ